MTGRRAEPVGGNGATRGRRAWYRSRWWIPGFSLFLGGVVFAAFWIGGKPWDGLWGFLVMAAVAALFLFGSRSETLRGLGGPGRDERFARIDTHATAFAGVVIILVLIGLWLSELAHGRDGSPYGQLMAVGGLSYVIAIAWLRWRS